MPMHFLRSFLSPPPLLDLPAIKRIWWEDHNFRRYVASRIFFQLGRSMAAGCFAVHGVQHYDLPDQQAAVFSGSLLGGGMVGFLVWGVVGDRFGGRNILLVLDLMQSLALVLALLSSSVGVWPDFPDLWVCSIRLYGGGRC